MAQSWWRGDLLVTSGGRPTIIDTAFVTLWVGGFVFMAGMIFGFGRRLPDITACIVVLPVLVTYSVGGAMLFFRVEKRTNLLCVRTRRRLALFSALPLIMVAFAGKATPSLATGMTVMVDIYLVTCVALILVNHALVRLAGVRPVLLDRLLCGLIVATVAAGIILKLIGLFK